MEHSENGSRRGPIPEKLFLLREFLRDYRIASVKSTSAYLVRRICNRIDFSRPRVVVEYGPGTGPFTRMLLERLPPGSRLILIERNPDFVRLLRKLRDPRAAVFWDSAENVRAVLREAGVERADYVLSGIPFSLYREADKRAILRDTRAVLDEHGAFIVYQSSGHLKRYLDEVFRRVSLTVEPFHIPPLFVMEARALPKDGTNGRSNGNGASLSSGKSEGTRAAWKE
jgi:phospholipid N-methyltransferase